ncbi:MAG: hypothetical protein SNG38_08610 [Rikenellaceae bacterium]
MEQDFDFSQIRWILIFGAIILFNFFNKKPKVDPQHSEDNPDAQGAEEMPTKRFEELFGQLFEGDEPQQTEEPKRDVIESAPKKVRKPKKEITRPRVATKEDVASSEIGSESSAGIDFDLREAVIMSEILKRKYEE